MYSRLSVFGAGFSIFAAVSVSHAQLQLEEVASGLNSPVFLTSAMDGTGRLFIVEKPGFIRILYPDGEVGGTPFIDLSAQVQGLSNEGGLLGLAFHPGFADSESVGHGLLYLNYTSFGVGDTFITEFAVSLGDPDLVDLGSQRTVMLMEQPYGNHNGGWIGFGPDGYLYIATGDGGSAFDPENRSSDLSSFMGKIHRIDVDGGDDFPLDPVMNFAVPNDNPFVTEPGALPSVWSYGLRNPWRSSFDRVNGDFWIGDVGQWNWEEINHNVGNEPGLFYGWRCREGFESTGRVCGASGWTEPVHAYANGSSYCSVTGGYVYRGCALGENFYGKYFYSDYCNGMVSTLDPANGYAMSEEVNADFGASSFGEDEDGELYITNASSGRVFRLVNPEIVNGCDEACVADFTGDGELNFFDVSLFLSLFVAQDALADINGDGNHNFFDVSAFLNLFSAGCP